MCGFKFRRQFGIGKFILDFYSPALKLAIEIDGQTHCGDEAQMYDQKRTEFLNSVGINCIRFSDDDVLRGLDEVKNSIWIHIAGMAAPNPSGSHNNANHLPLAGEENTCL
jgi:very-short-patch-repair endonuclease